MPRPLNADVHLLAILYGDRNVTDEAVFERMYAAMENKEGFVVDDDSLGGDVAWESEGVCRVFERGGWEGQEACGEGRDGAEL